MNPLANLDEERGRALCTAVNYSTAGATDVDALYAKILSYLEVGGTEDWTDDIWACYQLKCFRDREGPEAGREQLLARIACGFNKCMMSERQKNYFCDWLDAVDQLPANACLFRQFQCADPVVFSILGY